MTLEDRIEQIKMISRQFEYSEDNMEQLTEDFLFEEGFSRDVTNIGHWGCGAVELYLQSSADFEKAKSLIDRAFDEN